MAQHPEKAAPLKNLGEVYWSMGQQAQARPFFEKALAILEETAFPEHPDISLLQKRLGILEVGLSARNSCK